MEYEKHDRDSVSIHGVKEYTCNAGNLIVGKERAEQIATAILGKYKDGIQHMEAYWRGKESLEINQKFQGAGRYDVDYTEYNCVSNESVLKNGFRQTTKGREVK